MAGYETKLLISHQFTTCKIPVSRIFSNNLPIVSKKLMSG